MGGVGVGGVEGVGGVRDRILEITFTLATGIVYLSESISKLNYMPPHHIHALLISSKVRVHTRQIGLASCRSLV